MGLEPLLPDVVLGAKRERRSCDLSIIADPEDVIQDHNAVYRTGTSGIAYFSPMNKAVLIAVGAVVLVFGGLGYVGYTVVSGVISPARSDRPLSDSEAGQVQTSITILHKQGLSDDEKLAITLLKTGLWRAATPQDVFMKEAQAEGDTPFAYTLSNGHHPSAIVLASRFFTDTTDTGRAAIMIHEMGHYRAYVSHGQSTEYDGYKAEYDKSKKLGLSERDGLVYFGMLDGVVEYVVPVDKSYAKQADVKGYMDQPGP